MQANILIADDEKEIADLLVPLLPRLGAEVGILVPGLGFPGKSLHQILFGFGSGVFGHGKILPSCALSGRSGLIIREKRRACQPEEIIVSGEC